MHMNILKLNSNKSSKSIIKKKEGAIPLMAPPAPEQVIPPGGINGTSTSIFYRNKYIEKSYRNNVTDSQ